MIIISKQEARQAINLKIYHLLSKWKNRLLTMGIRRTIINVWRKILLYSADSA
jgi:hypothetical protein